MPQEANLDEGALRLTAREARISALVKKAVG
jgi:hypothetical protein